MHPQLPEMIKYASERDIKTLTSTNAHFLHNDAYLKRILTSGLTTLIIAIDSLEQDMYEVYRKKGRFSKAVEGLRRVVQLKREFKSTTRIHLRMVIMKQNEHELARMRSFAKEVGVDVFTVKTVISTNGNATNSAKRIERLVSAGPSAIIVCVDGADQDTYQTYRKGGQLKCVLQTIQRLAETKERLGVSNPLIEFRLLATKHSEFQLPELLKLAQESGADLFSVKRLRPYNYRGGNADNLLVPDQDRLSRYSYAEGKREAFGRKDFIPEGQLN